MNPFSLFKKLRATSSGKRYVAYLRGRGMRIGRNTAILAPRHTYFDEGRADFISIGEGCVICKNTSFIAHDYSWTVLRKKYGAVLPSGGGAISIGNNVFVGEGTIVLRGVTVGDNVVIGAGSLVSRDIPSDCVAVGNPARVIMSLEEYRQKRADALLEEARENAVYLYRRHGSVPEESKMKNFRVLFMPRTAEENARYLRENGCLGDCAESFMESFNATPPLYPSYEAFIRDMLKGVAE